VLEFFLGWLLFVLLGIASLGLGFLFAFITRLVVSAVVLKIADSMSDRLTIRGFVPAVLGALVLALTSSVADFVLHR
jgi:putative membrane protein